MTTCHGCNRPLEPLAAIRTYHAGCDPKGRVEMLERALADAIEGWEEGASYKGEYLRKKHRDDEGIAKARAALEYKPAPKDT